MNTQQLFDTIESPLFHATLGVVSTPRAFDSAMLRQEPVRLLINESNATGRHEELYARIIELIDDPLDDPLFCHPHDLPLAVYLRVLDVLSSEYSFPAAELLAEHRNLWWARAMAQRVLSEPKSKSTTHYEKVESNIYSIAYMAQGTSGPYAWENAKHSVKNVLKIAFVVLSTSHFVAKTLEPSAGMFMKKVGSLS